MTLNKRIQIYMVVALLVLAVLFVTACGDSPTAPVQPKQKCFVSWTTPPDTFCIDKHK